MNIKALIVALACATLPTTLASAEPFTYQGSLSDNGAPATGEYDLIFRLFDAANAGAQLGAQVVRENTPVADGLFTVELDFGNNLFLTTPRFLQVEVRPGASGGLFDILTPRTPINPAPAAHHATNATHATTADALSNPIWNQSGSTISAGTGANRVFINRSAPITAAEYFGVHADVAGFVGMYMSGPANSVPFYGYSVNGAISAYTFFNSDDSSWNVVGAGLVTSLRVTSDNNVEVANDIQAESYQFETPKLNYISVMGDSFHSASNDPFIASTGNGGAYLTNTGTGWLVAPIQIPHGATVTKVRFYFNDSHPGADVSISLTRRNNGGAGFFFMTDFNTAGFNGSYLVGEDSTITGAVIDNSLYSYQLRAWCPNWPGDSTLAIQSVVVEYTTTQAD